LLQSFYLPDLGEGVVEGELVKWLIKNGDSLVRDNTTCEVMTDKATIEIPFPYDTGVVSRLLISEGNLVKVGEEIFQYDTNGDKKGFTPSPKSLEIIRKEKIDTSPTQSILTPKHIFHNFKDAPVTVQAAPTVRKLANELGIDLSRLSGSGPNGRIIRQDILRAERELTRQIHENKELKSHIVPLKGDIRKPLQGLRKTIAVNMIKSSKTIPHFSFMEEMDASNLMGMRDKYNNTHAKTTSYLPFFIQAALEALKEFPLVHSALDIDDKINGHIVYRHQFNIGVAMASPEGLMVPVIKNAEQLSLAELNDEITRLRKLTVNKKLVPADLTGGTFTITSLGKLAGLMATPIINAPEVGILSVHTIKERPMVYQGKIAIRPILNLVGTFDHRVVDGRIAAEFIQFIILKLQHKEAT